MRIITYFILSQQVNLNLREKEYTIRVNHLTNTVLMRETERFRGSEVACVTVLKAKLTSRLKSRDRRH